MHNPVRCDRDFYLKGLYIFLNTSRYNIGGNSLITLPSKSWSYELLRDCNSDIMHNLTRLNELCIYMHHKLDIIKHLVLYFIHSTLCMSRVQGTLNCHVFAVNYISVYKPRAQGTLGYISYLKHFSSHMPCA